MVSEEDGQGQKVLIIKLHPEDFNWIPIIYSSFGISINELASLMN